LKYQSSPRFIKAMTHSFRHPTIERESIESNHAPVLHEGNLPPADAVVERVDAHAQVARCDIDIEPAWFNDRILRVLARFHNDTPTSEQL
jgi:hypothetical protein